MLKMRDTLKTDSELSDEEAAGDHLKVLMKVFMKVNQAERACSEEK